MLAVSSWDGVILVISPTNNCSLWFIIRYSQLIIIISFFNWKWKNKITHELTNMGYRIRNGSNFSNTTIDRLLRDSTAKGLRITNYTKSKKWHPQFNWPFCTKCPTTGWSKSKTNRFWCLEQRTMFFTITNSNSIKSGNKIDTANYNHS